MNTHKYHSYDYSISASAIQQAIVDTVKKPLYQLSPNDINQAKYLLRALEIMHDYCERAQAEENDECEEKARTAANEPAPF